MKSENSSSEFSELFHGHELKENLLKKTPAIIEAGSKLITNALNEFSIPQYNNGKNIEFHWRATTSFQASASIRNQDTHEIKLSYGVPISIYKDAYLVSHLLKKGAPFDSKICAQLPALTDTHQIDSYLSDNNNNGSIRSLLFTNPLLWVFFHEQAHLFQNHGELYLRETLRSRSDYEWIEIFDKTHTPLTGEEAWTRHCFEFSADYEATHSLIYYEIEKKGKISFLSIWTILFSLSRLFFRFHEDTPKSPLSEAVGSHPVPYIRMYLASICVLDFLDRPEVFKHIDWASNRDDLRRIMDHAILSAQTYTAWARITPNDDNIEIGAGEYQQIETYIYLMLGKWKDLHPKILPFYFGSASIMPMWS
ncbi:hypothetical protein U2261_08345 [Achromobacter xylosoxidans]|uniref:hypothetical protein n=1 Tax=Alcaligenes xylosoxydans xylosoxydans TaxID=85698 RepID=UPI002ACA0AD9|nr:hypothetical protein [Achromobacter xylosoxidans]MDZ5614609.1 hypothetical protein [Achromobacter xylosoxidans]MDZ5625400.1 hypothetical protein [Achromobacter xylosoxidans]MDZ5685605.1 hypothetical protein [Achromobacter xylosoxidans]